jgi:hypothetical protein
VGYLKTVALGLDDLGAAILLGRNDLCISAACGLVIKRNADKLKLSVWQLKFLTVVGAQLDHYFPGHCEGAIGGDIARANSTLQLLTSKQ